MWSNNYYIISRTYLLALSGDIGRDAYLAGIDLSSSMSFEEEK